MNRLIECIAPIRRCDSPTHPQPTHGQVIGFQPQTIGTDSWNLLDEVHRMPPHHSPVARGQQPAAICIAHRPQRQALAALPARSWLCCDQLAHGRRPCTGRRQCAIQMCGGDMHPIDFISCTARGFSLNCYPSVAMPAVTVISEGGERGEGRG